MTWILGTSDFDIGSRKAWCGRPARSRSTAIAAATSLTIERKGRQDFVSEADKACEEFVVGALLKAFPEDAFLGEEGGAQNAGGEATWIIDPIDGTTNFIAGIPVWCVSLGLVIGGKSVLGVIYNPVTEEFYSAQAGEGAFLNGKRIQVSGAQKLDEARMHLGFSYRRPVQEHIRRRQRLPGGELRICPLRVRRAGHGLRRRRPVRRLLRGPHQRLGRRGRHRAGDGGRRLVQ